jgi:hypothetical protein
LGFRCSRDCRRPAHCSRENGLPVEVKKRPESKKPWDYYKQLALMPGDKAFPAAKDSGCPLVSAAGVAAYRMT